MPTVDVDMNIITLLPMDWMERNWERRTAVWAVRAPVRKFFFCWPRRYICLSKGCISVKQRHCIRLVVCVAGLLHTIGVKLRCRAISVIICLCWYRYIDPRYFSYVYRHCYILFGICNVWKSEKGNILVNRIF